MERYTYTIRHNSSNQMGMKKNTVITNTFNMYNTIKLAFLLLFTNTLLAHTVVDYNSTLPTAYYMDASVSDTNSIKNALQAQGIDESRITGLAIGKVDHASNKTTSKPNTSDHENLLESDQYSQADDMPLQTGLADIQSTQPDMEKVKARPHVLDRRVSIELSVMDSSDHAPVASLAALETSRAEQ